jgi:[FeFe] hydrogenase H-cluster maturation GTPase HydF
MGLNDTPSGERVHIGLYGRTNVGKSSLINGIANQEIAMVSNLKGTTTDPVYKAMELLPMGPVVLMDTPGLDDDSQLGKQRIQKSYQLINKTDIGILVTDGINPLTEIELELINRFRQKNIPFLIVVNKADQLVNNREDVFSTQIFPQMAQQVLFVSALNKEDMIRLRNEIAKTFISNGDEKFLVRDLMAKGDKIVLVIPIDKAAPKGRLILPQQQTIREILDGDGIVIMAKEDQLESIISENESQIRMVITDSQVFEQVEKIVPREIPLTSFSILFARYKGELEQLVKGAQRIDELPNDCEILISEGCSHHRQCGDIGSEKLPNWIRKATNKKCNFTFTSGTQFPEDLSRFHLIIHCGGCMLNEREVKYRLACAADAKIPMTNYGIAIAHMNGILLRTIEVFPEIRK